MKIKGTMNNVLKKRQLKKLSLNFNKNANQICQFGTTRKTNQEK